MTVSTQISREEYTGNGVTTDFDYRFRVFSADELVVSVADTTENISTLVLNTDYTVTGAGSRTGGKVKLVNPLANAWRISIDRDLPVTQETDVRNQGNFFPEVHEDAFDKLTMLIQQALGVFGLALRKPNLLAKYYDALGNRIANLGSPVNSQDATTKSYVDAAVGGSTGHADDLFKRTLRVPEQEIGQLPAVSRRRNSLVGINDRGDPVPVFSMTETADLALKLASVHGAELIGTQYGGTVFDAINAITPEMFGAVGDGVADDVAALQAAIDYAVRSNKRRVVGMGSYNISKSLLIGGSVGIGTGGMSIRVARLRAAETWPANTGLFDATPMIIMGNASGNETNIELSIGYLDGAGKADGLQPTGFGFSLARIHIGHATNCIRVIGTGTQQWSNASVYITGNSWRVNWLGLHLERGSSGTSPINEGWNIDIGFTWSNRYGGFLLRGGSQYAKIAGDFDFNGNYVSLLEVDKITGVQRGMKLTNGTTSCEVLSFYNYRGENYIALAENKVVAGNRSSYIAGDTLSGAPSAIKVNSVITTQTNATSNNFFDIWHDFQGEPFAALNIRSGYCGGIYGALQHTSRIFYNNNFDGRPDNWRGLGVANSGSTLTMYDKAKSDAAFATISGDSYNIDRRLYLKARLYEGIPVAKAIPKSSTDFTFIYKFSDPSLDKYLDEGSMFEITLKGNFGGTYGRWLIFIKADNLQVVDEKYNSTVFEYRFNSLNFEIRQAAQNFINVAVNIRRV